MPGGLSPSPVEALGVDYARGICVGALRGMRVTRNGRLMMAPRAVAMPGPLITR